MDDNIIEGRIVRADPSYAGASAPLSVMPAMGVADATARYQALVSFTRGIMRRDVDYGVIPGTAKPTLLKPGAEKLSTYFGLTTRPRVVQRIERWDEDFFSYEVEVDFLRGDRLVTVGLGSCNSRESRYRWRWVPEADLPDGLDRALLVTRGGTESEFDFAVEKAETTGKYGKPAAYWQSWKDDIEAGRATPSMRKVKSGREMKAWSRSTLVYRVPNEDVASLVNTILKMAVKRAFIDGCLRAVNASEYFTQDIEDLDFGTEPYSPAPAVDAWHEAAADTATPAPNDANGHSDTPAAPDAPQGRSDAPALEDAPADGDLPGHAVSDLPFAEEPPPVPARRAKQVQAAPAPQKADAASGDAFAGKMRMADTLADLNAIAREAKDAGAWQAVYPVYVAMSKMMAGVKEYSGAATPQS